jgi:predicted TPR repeat methyltransferase
MNRAARRAAKRGTKSLPGGLSPGQALLEAIRRHRAGDLRSAEVAYRRILRSMPHDVDALHFLGVLRHQQGCSEEGSGLVQRALVLAPACVDAWSNLGNVYKESGRLADAEAAYRRAIALEERHAAAWNNLGVVLQARDEPTQAVEALQHAIEISPAFADAHFNHGNALRECRRIAEAIAAYRQALLHNPAHTQAHYRLGYALYISGARSEALDVFRSWLAIAPENPIPSHMLAALSGENVPERASDDYVRITFDGFASSFDDVLLHRLDYRAPQLLLDAVAAVLGPPRSACDILDAGCGTGLCGPLLAPYARSLSGVDLSQKMLVRARARGTYDRLHEEEITCFLAARDSSFDVIASADTLCYFGDLQLVAQTARKALRAGGWMVFTVERDDEVETYRIQPHGRYSHARGYLERVFAASGFEAIDLTGAVLRRELGSDVNGWIVRARVPNAARAS